MKKAIVDRIPFANIVTVLAIALSASIGLCGLNWFLISTESIEKNSGYFRGPILSTAGEIELGIMLISALGLIATLVAWIVTSLIDNFSGRAGDTQRLFENPEDRDGRS